MGRGPRPVHDSRHRIPAADVVVWMESGFITFEEAR